MKYVKNQLLLQIFPNFSTEDLQFLEKRTNLIKLSKAQPVFLAGDKSKFLFAVVSGSLKITRETISGSSVITRIVGPGKLVGFREFFSDFIYSRNCFALEESEVLAIHHEAIMTLMKRSTQINLYFFKLFSNELKRMEDMLESHLNRTAKKRLATILYDFYQMFASKNTSSFLSPLNRKDMAELAGMTPETVSRILNNLKKLNILSTTGKKFIVLNPDALKHYDD